MDVEKAIEFLMAEAARVAARLSRLESSLTVLTDNVGTLTNNMGTLTGNMSTLTDNMSTLTDNMGVLTDSVIKLTEQMRVQDEMQRHLTALFDRLEDQQSETDARLRALIQLLEKRWGGSNGNAPHRP